MVLTGQGLRPTVARITLTAGEISEVSTMHNLKQFIRSMIVIAIISLVFSCSDDNNNVIMPPIDGDETALLDTLEARNIAMWITGELTAPEELVLQILDDLKQIRADYLDILPLDRWTQLPLRFWTPWENSAINLVVSSETYERYQRGEWEDFEILNDMYEMSSMTTINTGTGGYYLMLRFEGEKNSIVLCDAYSQLGDAIQVKIEPSYYLKYLNTAAGLGLKLHYPVLWPYHIDNDVTYYYIKPLASPFPGITYAEYWYFRSTGAGIILVGYWDRRNGGPWPEWWQEANLVFEELETTYKYW